MTSDSQTPPAVPGEPEAAPGEAGPAERLAALEAENADLKDRALRALAEIENVRRRTQREKEEASRFAIAGFARDLLSSADNLRRALASVSPAEAETAGPLAKTLLTGVAATERELVAALERHGLQRVEAAPGERFDHNLHQAVYEAPDGRFPPGAIVEVLQSGWRLHDRLLRPAMVGVAKAAPASGEPPARVDTMA